MNFNPTKLLEQINTNSSTQNHSEGNFTLVTHGNQTNFSHILNAHLVGLSFPCWALILSEFLLTLKQGQLPFITKTTKNNHVNVKFIIKFHDC